jgi:hypothetical protein
VKERIAEALGYPVPNTFVRTKPRFSGQCFDTYIQKSNNLQIWNEELASIRRYVMIRVDDDCRVACVRVVTGETLALLDTTGTLTQKYQARLIPGKHPTELISARDTDRVLKCFGTRILDSFASSPTENPIAECLLPIVELFKRISSLVGRLIVNPGIDQERNRGGSCTVKSAKPLATKAPEMTAGFQTCGINCSKLNCKRLRRLISVLSHLQAKRCSMFRRLTMFKSGIAMSDTLYFMAGCKGKALC